VRAADLDSLFAGEIAPGVYRLRSRVSPEELAGRAAEHGWRLFHLDGRQIVDKVTFLRTAAAALAFPAYFGRNWDAFEESLTDLAWAPAQGYVILYDDVAPFATQAGADWRMALEILREATTTWHERGVPLLVLLRRTGEAIPGMPSL
jgi:RNAse (barnase) inhibitor barstar